MTTGRTETMAVITVTKRGTALGARFGKVFPGSRVFAPEKFVEDGDPVTAYTEPVRDIVAAAFRDYRSLVLIMAAGAAVRLIAPYITTKRDDPGVVVVDEGGTFAVSLLSGHAGGANELASRVAAAFNAWPVVTTASDVAGTFAVDLLGQEWGWQMEEGSHVTAVSAALVNGKPVGLYQDAGERDWRRRPLPANVREYATPEEVEAAGCQAAIIITDREIESGFTGPAVIYRPRSLIIGLGCNRGTPAATIAMAVDEVLCQNGFSARSIRTLATIDVKRDEPGVSEYARARNLPVDYHGREALRQADFPSSPSPAAEKYVGTPSVCEAAALLSGAAALLIPKTSYQRAVTVAVGRAVPEEKAVPGKLYLVGLGPGGPGDLTFRAREALAASQSVVGYKTYVALITPFLDGKEIIATGMGDEIERARAAVDLAARGKTVAIVCSGDSGIYGMAGLVLEILQNAAARPHIEVIPGVPSLAAAAACLGAPLMNDFAVISLSDHLVDNEDIFRRVELAARGDFVIVIHNPKSRQRPDYLAWARDIIRRWRGPQTPAGIVTAAGRPEQQITVTDLAHLLDFEVNMNTTVIIGNSESFSFDSFMVTPRGYHTKYSLKE